MFVLKGLFGKAKRKFLGKDREDGLSASGGYGSESSDSSRSPSTVDAGGIDPTLWEPQELGMYNSKQDRWI